MPGPEVVQPLEPWQTVWPAAVALVVALGAALRGRRAWWPARADLPWMLGVGALALVVRLAVIPALLRYYPDGHEAEYWDIFRGARPLSRGGTVLYPAMQWMWWALGQVLPHRTGTLVISMSVVGALGAVVWGAAVRRWLGAWAGLVAALLVALHPVHAAWSSSAYNVILPWTLSAIVLWCSASIATERHPDTAVAWMGAAAFVLAVSTRMDAAMVAVPAGLLVLLVAPSGMPLGRAVRRRVSLGTLSALSFSLVFAALAVWPLVFPGEVPGAGERAVSFSINRFWLAPHTPFDGWTSVLLLAVAAVGASLRRPVLGLVWAGCGVGVHLLMASFDDYGDRHALWALFGWTALLAALPLHKGASLPRWGGRLVVVAAAAVSVAGLGDMRERFYGSEESHAALLDSVPPWSELPRWSVAQARKAPDGGPCGWVNEDPRVSPSPQLSHFNLIRPDEAEALRGPSGCLRWCADVQDWRWSSRGVRDRALRTAHLYALEPVAVVTDSASGYACLVLELGPRLHCRGSDSQPAQGSEAGPTPDQGALP
mgnify:CR=1 FL=1